ncbi:MAG: thiamine pyrophosphate-binding protein, partial [Clostridia bacterium]|nr:thiamine pyrophosphate-binding protein [Clostridia bacterium]
SADGVPAPAPADVERVAVLLRQARRPVLYVGGGLAHETGRRALKRFSEKVGVPVVTTVKGKAAFPADHPLAVGASSWAPEIMASDLLRGADLVLAVGTRLSARLKYGGYGDFRLPERLVHVDVDPSVVGRNFPTELGVVADGAAFLEALADACAGDPAVREEGLARAAATRQAVAASLATRAPAIAEFLRQLRAALPRETVFIGDNALAGIWAARYFPVYEPGQFLFPMGYGTLGFAVPAAVGARFGCPDRPVVALVGDGGFLFSAQELAVAVQFGLDLVVVLVNDRRYGSVHYNQRRRYGRTVATELWNPDFAAFAAAFGAGYRLAEGPADVGEAVRGALAQGGVQLVEVDGSFIDWY